MNRNRIRGALLASAVVGLLLVPAASQAFVGYLSSDTGGILGSGNWMVGGVTRLDWVVTQNANQSWHYDYTFSHPAGATSHLLLEVSRTFTRENIFNESGDFGSLGVDWFGDEGGSNPLIPEVVYAIKFDSALGTSTHIAFDSDRAPMWGDFYSKDGNVGGYGQNAAWNAGFTTADTDPTDPAADGSLANHLLVPDTVTTPIPEPTTLLLLGGGLLGGVIARRRKKA
jgi:hypothetical protein